ncbi:MAG: hypothetical protein J1D88_09575 [Treponema sp.]|nr:hypothetical protein [Treponema sp.]
MKGRETFDNYEVYVGKNALRVVPEGYSHSFVAWDGSNYKGKGTFVPLGIALANFDKPFVTFGLPKKLRKYIEKRAKNIVKVKGWRKGRVTIAAPGPSEGIALWIYPSKGKLKEPITEENTKKWFEEGVSLMTMEEGKIYAKLFDKIFVPEGDDRCDAAAEKLNMELWGSPTGK